MDKVRIPKQLNNAICNLYKNNEIEITMTPVYGKYNYEYDGMYLALNNQNVVYRSAKVTPKKIGQFVAVWKKKKGINHPYESSDKINLIIVDVSLNNKCGQFIFDREILIKKGILTHEGKIGKMAFRVYPPWDTPIAKQAISTQKWQLKYYIDYSSIDTIEKQKLHKLIMGDFNEDSSN